MWVWRRQEVTAGMVDVRVDAQRRRLDTELSAKVVVREGVLQDRPGPSIAGAGVPGLAVRIVVRTSGEPRCFAGILVVGWG